MKRSAAGLIVALALAAAPLCAAADDLPEVTHDGLRRLPNTKVDAAWAAPQADFGPYRKVMLDPVAVAFRKHWKSDHPRASSKDMERIARKVAELCRASFVKVLGESRPTVEAKGADVLRVRVAIVDLDVTAPDVGVGRTRTYAASAGAATLFLELYDSETGAILARAVDRERARDVGTAIRMTGSSVHNAAEARHLFERWAKLLAARLDEIQGKKG